MVTEPQSVELTAFLAAAECHILEAAKRSMEGAGESLISAGCYYAPKLLAAVKVALKNHWPEYTSWGDVCGGCWTAGSSHPIWPCPPMVDLVNALLGKVPDAV